MLGLFRLLLRLKEIAEKGFSPSSLTNYIRNPIQFYFQRILRISEVDEVEENIALVVSTSGSTGAAKSVLISSAALIASTNACHKYLGAVPGDSWSLLLPTTHIAGLNVLIRATALGTRVIDNRNTTNYVDADFTIL